MPYREDIRAQLPEQCLQDEPLWRGVVPLICYNILEWHQPDRVLLQFGLSQPIPKKPAQDARLHDISLRGKVDRDWSDEMMLYVQQWAHRLALVVPETAPAGPRGPSDRYMLWYKRITRRWMDVKNARLDLMVRLIYIFLVLWSK